MTYEENLRKTAEEITEAHRHLVNGGYSIECAIALISEYCLKKQAEAYLKGFIATNILRKGFDNENDPLIKHALKQLGLIP